tara:strand:- start:162 stop:359 length:198 start_codon:yes stop_codon:yes gene_type:complete
MNKKHFLFGILAIVFLFFIFTFVRARTIPAHRHHHRNKRIGGCRGTRYGCCPDSRKACNKNCSNC